MSACDPFHVEWNLLGAELLKMRSSIQELLALEGAADGTKGASGLTAGELVRLLDGECKAAAVAAVSARRVCDQCQPDVSPAGKVVDFPLRGRRPDAPVGGAGKTG